MRNTALFLVFIIALGIIPVFAQEAVEREDFWVCPVFESGMYSITNIAIGGGAAIGYGDRLVFGLKVIYWKDMEDIISLELNLLARFYFYRMMGSSGLFIQFNGGPVIFAKDETNIDIPSEIATISAGLSLGWRFLLGANFFAETAVRIGYPYIAGVGLSAGVRF